MVAYSFAHLGDLDVSTTPRVRRLLRRPSTTFGYISGQRYDGTGGENDEGK
jgi:hypothetical protein